MSEIVDAVDRICHVFLGFRREDEDRVRHLNICPIATILLLMVHLGQSKHQNG